MLIGMWTIVELGTSKSGPRMRRKTRAGLPFWESHCILTLGLYYLHGKHRAHLFQGQDCGQGGQCAGFQEIFAAA